MSRKIFLTAMVTMILGVSVGSAALYDPSKHFYQFWHFVLRDCEDGKTDIVRYGFNMRDNVGAVGTDRVVSAISAMLIAQICLDMPRSQEILHGDFA